MQGGKEARAANLNIGNSQRSLSKRTYILLELKNVWTITLRITIRNIIPNITGNVSINDTIREIFRDRIQYPRDNHLIAPFPLWKTRWINRRWRKRTVDEAEFIFGTEGDGHGTTSCAIICSSMVARPIMSPDYPSDADKGDSMGLLMMHQKWWTLVQWIVNNRLVCKRAHKDAP